MNKFREALGIVMVLQLTLHGSTLKARAGGRWPPPLLPYTHLMACMVGLIPTPQRFVLHSGKGHAWGIIGQKVVTLKTPFSYTYALAHIIERQLDSKLGKL
jgi:hypothetical protein